MRSVIIVFAAGLALAGCARDQSPDVYSRGEVGTTVSVQEAQVLSVRDVRIEGTRSGVGVIAGAAAGGVGGSYLGKGRGGIIGAIVGAVAGGLIGGAMEEAVVSTVGVEYLVRLENGETVAVVQPKGKAPLQPGDRALLVYGDHIRVVPAGAHDYTPNQGRDQAPNFGSNAPENTHKNTHDTKPGWTPPPEATKV